MLFCGLCGAGRPGVTGVKSHITRSSDDDHEGRSGRDPGVVIDVNGEPVETPTPGSEGSDRLSGSVRGRTTERRAALLAEIEKAGGSPHVITHSEQAGRFGVAIATINQDLRHLRETGEIAETEPTERRSDGEPIFRCGFCGEPCESVRAVETHVTKKSDPDHRDRTGSDPNAIQRRNEENHD
jgi:hypothetical protein